MYENNVEVIFFHITKNKDLLKGEYVLKKNKKYILLCIVFVFVLFPMNSFAKVKTKPNLIWFGDSRTVGLGTAVYSYVPTGMPYTII